MCNPLDKATFTIVSGFISGLSEGPKRRFMSYAILRVRKLSTAGQMAGMQRHNDRTNNVRNADPDLSHMNQSFSWTDTGDLRNDVDQRLDDAQVKVRSNSVKCLEFLMTASPEAFEMVKFKRKDGHYGLKGDVKKWNEFSKRSIKWLRDTYGKENLVHASIHFDEKTPHIHAYVTPITKKEVKWKNQKGSGVKVVNSLTARDIVGGKEKLRAMQDDFARVVGDLGLERGKRGSQASHEHISKYYARVNQAQKFEKDLDNFKPTKESIELSSPGLFENKEKWAENEQNKINYAMENAQQDALKQFRELFEGDFERMMESSKERAIMASKIENLSKELSVSKETTASVRLANSKNIQTIQSQKEQAKKVENAVLKALKGDLDAQQALLNYFRPQQQNDLTK